MWGKCLFLQGQLGVMKKKFQKMLFSVYIRGIILKLLKHTFSRFPQTKRLMLTCFMQYKNSKPLILVFKANLICHEIFFLAITVQS